MKDREKTDIILRALREHFTSWNRDRTNLLFPELRLGSGYCGVAQRRIDMFVISSNKGNPTIAYEIKVSRGDFKKDVNDDLKQRGARLYANEFYYVTPKGLLDPTEIPLWAGLMELDIDAFIQGKGVYFDTVVPAPLHPKAMPSWGLICSLIRKIDKEEQLEQLRNEYEAQIKKLKQENFEIRRKNSDYAFKLMKHNLIDV